MTDQYHPTNCALLTPPHGGTENRAHPAAHPHQQPPPYRAAASPSLPGAAPIPSPRSAPPVVHPVFAALLPPLQRAVAEEGYVTPKGRCLEGAGVIPDVLTALTLADVRAGRDPDLEAALRALSARAPEAKR